VLGSARSRLHAGLSAYFELYVDGCRERPLASVRPL